MFYNFTKLEFSIEVNEAVNRISKEDFMKVSNSSLPQENCLFVLEEVTTKNILLLTHLGDIDNSSELDLVIKKVVEENHNNGLELLRYETLTAKDKRCLHTLHFSCKSFETLMIFTLVNNHIISLTCSFKQEDLPKMLELSFDLAKSIAPIKLV